MASVILVILANRVIIAVCCKYRAVRNILMHSLNTMQMFLMLQLTVHCSKYCAFKWFVIIKQPGGICHTCHACNVAFIRRQFDLVRLCSLVKPACVVSHSSPRLRSISIYRIFAWIKKISGNCSSSTTNPLNTKRRLLYLKTQFVPHSKHFLSRL